MLAVLLTASISRDWDDAHIRGGRRLARAAMWGLLLLPAVARSDPNLEGVVRQHHAEVSVFVEDKARLDAEIGELNRNEIRPHEAALIAHNERADRYNAYVQTCALGYSPQACAAASRAEGDAISREAHELNARSGVLRQKGLQLDERRDALRRTQARLQQQENTLRRELATAENRWRPRGPAANTRTTGPGASRAMAPDAPPSPAPPLARPTAPAATQRTANPAGVPRGTTSPSSGSIGLSRGSGDAPYGASPTYSAPPSYGATNPPYGATNQSYAPTQPSKPPPAPPPNPGAPAFEEPKPVPAENPSESGPCCEASWCYNHETSCINACDEQYPYVKSQYAKQNNDCRTLCKLYSKTCYPCCANRQRLACGAVYCWSR